MVTTGGKLTLPSIPYREEEEEGRTTTGKGGEIYVNALPTVDGLARV